MMIVVEQKGVELMRTLRARYNVNGGRQEARKRAGDGRDFGPKRKRAVSHSGSLCPGSAMEVEAALWRWTN